ncbi:MAG TPA: GNAT family N-acetyltransferase [Mesorhizobium sp.]|jgi:ribosomal protein S18 acetylase RimI-like enzyme
MFIRTAGERDLAAVRDLLAETWHATYDPLYGVDKVTEITEARHSVAMLRKMLARPFSEFVVADSGAGLAGLAHAAMLGEERQIVELHEFNVRPAMQGKGIGGLLLEEVEGSFFECRLMRLDVEERNSRAVAFFEAAGFVIAGRGPAKQFVDATLLTLEKPLA